MCRTSKWLASAGLDAPFPAMDTGAPTPWHKEFPMPYINIRITREGATSEQKAALIQGVTQLLVDILGKNPATTVVTIDEVDTDNWGVGGETITARRKRGA